MNHEPDSRLARRYRTLLRAYPRGYREERGEEILGTLLDTAGPGQSRPSLADATDLIAAGVRQRLAIDRVPALHRGLLLAGPVALGLAAGLSLFFWIGMESAWQPGDPSRVGPFATVAPVAYLGWVLAVLAPVALPRLGRRPWVAAALLLTLAIPLVGLTRYATPPAYVWLLLAGLGAVALVGDDTAQPARHRTLVAEVGFATAPVCFALVWLRGESFGGLRYAGYLQSTTQVAQLCLLALLAAVAVGITQVVRRGDTSWAWAALVLLVPLGWLAPAGFAEPPDLTPAPGYLALSVAVVVAVVWLARQRTATPGAVRPSRVLPATGAVALGCAAGLAAALWIGDLMPQPTGFPGTPVTEADRTDWWLYGGWIAVAVVAALVPAYRVRIGLVGAAVAATLGWYVLPRFVSTERLPLTALLVFALLGAAGLAAAKLPVRRFALRTGGAAAGVVAVLSGLAYAFDWWRHGTVAVLFVDTDRSATLLRDFPSDTAILEARSERFWVLEALPGASAYDVVWASALVAAVPLAFAGVILVRALLDRLYQLREN